jgi:hypothetical protein
VSDHAPDVRMRPSIPRTLSFTFVVRRVLDSSFAEAVVATACVTAAITLRALRRPLAVSFMHLYMSRMPLYEAPRIAPRYARQDRSRDRATGSPRSESSPSASTPIRTRIRAQQEVLLASGNNNNSVLMILALAILVLIGGFVAYRTNVFGGGGGGHGGGGHGERGGNP